MKSITIFVVLILGVLLTADLGLSQVIYQDDFEGGGNINWLPLFYSNDNNQWEENIEIVANPYGTGNVGKLLDADTSYTGAALSGGDVFDFANLSIEADVYCYVNTGTNTSKYTGIVLMADTNMSENGTISNKYVKMVADFDDNMSAGPRIRLYNNDLNMTTFQYSFDLKFYADNIPGGIPTEDGWHRMRMEAKTLNSDSVEYTLYFDGNLVGGGPVYDYKYNINDTTVHIPFTPGTFGLFAFQQNAALPGYFDNVQVEELVTSIDSNREIVIERYVLHQNYPNPFNPTTTIKFELPISEFVQLEVFNIVGQKVRTLANNQLNAGTQQVVWDAYDDYDNEVPAGLYYYRLRAGTFEQTRKMLLVK